MDATAIRRIEALQNDVYRRFGGRILNILNGQAMYNAFEAHWLMGNSDYVPFNEAMCSHSAHAPIFRDEFNEIRASGHGVSLAEYERITLAPLKPLFGRQYDCIVLWFGDDMFCQMNLLTVLAYLEQSGFGGKLIFHRIKESSTYEIDEIELHNGGNQVIYDQVLIHRQFPAMPVMPVMAEGIGLYLDYCKSENEITDYIRNHRDLPRETLLRQLFRRFPHYGLGDAQYLAIIEAIDNGPGGTASK